MANLAYTPTRLLKLKRKSTSKEGEVLSPVIQIRVKIINNYMSYDNLEVFNPKCYYNKKYYENYKDQNYNKI